jgi:hypothetical protein
MATEGSNGFGQWLTPDDARRITASWGLVLNAAIPFSTVYCKQPLPGVKVSKNALRPRMFSVTGGCIWIQIIMKSPPFRKKMLR